MSGRPNPIKLTPYTATARRRRAMQGTVEWYWTARCRRLGMEGEWRLGWFTSRRQAERALTEWVASRTGHRHRRGAPTMENVFDDYELAVERMASKKPTTRWNRKYTADQLRAFLREHHPEILADHFDAAKFEQYLGWLKDKGYRAQTIENALVGARTMLRWAKNAKLIAEPPGRPAFQVPPTERRRLARSTVDAVIGTATVTDEPVRLPLLLRVLWQTGMRPSEGFAIRKADVRPDAMLSIATHHDYSPKTLHSHRVVPIDRDLLADLLQLDHDPFFHAPEVDRVYHYWRHRLQRAIAEADVDEFTLGDFRKARSTRLLEVGTSLHVYGRMMGHSPKTALKHYAAVSEGDLRAAFERACDTDTEES